MSYDRQGRKVLPANDPAADDATYGGANLARGTNPKEGSRPRMAAARPSDRTAQRPKASGGALRVLPAVMIVAAVALSVKTTSLWTAFQTGAFSVSAFAPAEAESAPASGQAASDQGALPAPVQLAQAETTGSGTAAGANPDKPEDKPIDPVLFTRAEIEILQDLSQRRKELDAREQAVIQKEGLLTAAEDRIENKLEELRTIKVEIEGLIKKYEEQEIKQIDDLVAIYQRMKPKEAAQIFDELDIEILLQLFERMKSSKSAPILAVMRPQRAKEITSRIAERREFPTIN